MANIIINTINTILENLFSSIDNTLYSVLDDITFISSDILNTSYFQKILGMSASSGILIIANSLLLGYLIYFSIKYLLAHFYSLDIEAPHQFIFKLLFFGIAMNYSYFILEQILNISSNITLSIRNLGENIFNTEICFSSLINRVNSTIAINSISTNIFSIDGLIKSTLTFSLLGLVFSYSLRYIMIKVFALLSPFAILSLCLNSTSWFCKTWFRNLFSLLLIQIIVSIVLLILFSMDYNSDGIIVKFIYIGAIYALIRVNSFVREFVGGVSTVVSQPVNKMR
jgi:hypothetical protein